MSVSIFLASARRKPHQSRRSGKCFPGSRTCRHPDTSAPSNAQSGRANGRRPYTTLIPCQRGGHGKTVATLVGGTAVRLQVEARLRQPCPSRRAAEVKRQVCIPSVAPRFGMPFVACAPSCGFCRRYQPARLEPLQRPPRPTGPLLRRGCIVPSIHAMRPDPPVSTAPPDFPRTLVIQEALPDDLVWAAADTFPALGQHSFHACHHLYAGRRNRSISR
jgi:hypothetical protein